MSLQRPTDQQVRSALSALGQIVGETHVRSNPETLEKYAGDWSISAPCLPDIVVHPGSSEEVSAILKVANEHNIAVTPRGLGSGKAGGAIPLAGGIVLTTERMNRVEHVDKGDMLAIAGAGTSLAELWNTVESEGLFYPPDPNSQELCSIGGNVACNAGGPRALKYGVTKNYILGLEVVLPTGEILEVGKRTLKHVTGYDLCGMLVGSEGTLGIITRVIVRLLPKPQSVQTALVTFKDVHSASRALCQTLAEGHQPRTLELLDHHALAAVRAKLPGRFPDNAGAAIIAETDGPTDDRTFGDLERLADRLMSLGALDVLVAMDEAQRARVWEPRKIMSMMLRETADKKISEDIVVPRSKIPQMIEKAGEISQKHGVRVATYGHAGDGNLHVNVLFNKTQGPEADLAVIDVLKAAVELGGTISGEHGIGVAKRDFLPIEHPPEKIAVQRAIKRALDPKGILNPGKIFPEEK